MSMGILAALLDMGSASTLPTSSRPHSASPPLTFASASLKGCVRAHRSVVYYRGMTRARLDYDLAQLEADVGGETATASKPPESEEGDDAQPLSGAALRPSAHIRRKRLT